MRVFTKRNLLHEILLKTENDGTMYEMNVKICIERKKEGGFLKESRLNVI